MDGSKKLTPLLIGKADKPRCFKGIHSFPITYHSNKKVWMTTQLFNEWLVSLNKDMKKQKRKILLFLNKCTVHNIPPSLTNIELQSIIKNFKLIIRKIR